jgi:cysteine-rich repeat protein
LRALSAASLASFISAIVILEGCSGGNADSLSTSKLPVADANLAEDDAGEEPDQGDEAGSDEEDAGGGQETDAEIEELDGEVVVVADPACGDGQLNVGEACDNGAANSDSAADACRVNCQLARCGDGVLDSAEACDLGARNSDDEPDACREDCTRPRCGDGTIDQGEQCDTGAARSDTAPGACRADCRDARCGDGVTDPDEACDDRNTDEQDGCLNSCRSASCGDGVTGPNEECDDGNTADGDGCQSTCRRPICGDRVIDSGEQCDDGNTSSNDGCRADCNTGCVAARECDDGTYCNGAERCVDGLCQAGPAVALDDGVSCTVDACDESGDAVTHAADDGLCSVQPTSCTGAVRISHEASCSAGQGCQGNTTRTGCPDARAICTPRADGSIELATFTPACNGDNSDCGAPAASLQSCAAPPPTCDTRARVGTVLAATCDPASESCGTRVAQVNDCTALDDVRCGRGNLSAERDVGQCDARGQCGTSTTQEDCDPGAAACQNGRVLNSAPTCTAGTGCGAPALTPGALCEVAVPTCTVNARVPVYTTFTPACADATRCLPRGTPVEDLCDDAPIRSCVGSELQIRQARCKEGRGCTMDVEATQDCGLPTCVVTGAAQVICGGCGADPTTGAAVCLSQTQQPCRACPTGQACVSAATGAFCRASITPPRVDGGIIVLPVTPVLDAGIIAIDPGVIGRQ